MTMIPLDGAAQPLPLIRAPYGSAVAPLAALHHGVLPLQQEAGGSAAIVSAETVPTPEQLAAALVPSQTGLVIAHGAEKPPVVSDVPLSSIADGDGQSGSKLDLTMELGDIVKDMNIAECEQQLYQRVAQHEMALNAQAGAEVQAAVSRHEMWLNEKAEAEVQRARMEVHQALYAHEARQHQLALVSRDSVRQGEAQFMENAESEMKQCEKRRAFHVAWLSTNFRQARASFYWWP